MNGKVELGFPCDGQCGNGLLVVGITLLKVGRGYRYSELSYGQLKKSQRVVESWAIRLRTN